jgi:hypothetical protein
MAKITLDLNQFKASGVYTVEFDASERIVVTSQTVRLVVGFSRIGPFNAPVFLRDVATARRVFGPIDAYLEKRGSFFHRAIETCLQSAPIFALNLLPLNNIPANEGGDAVQYRSFSLEAAGENGTVTEALLSSFYNKERFWFADTNYLQATVDSKPANRGRLFNLVNLSQQETSIIIRKSVNASLYNITAQDYFGTDDVPEYVNPTDYVSDYFVDVFVVKGNWSDLPSLSKDPVWSKYFDARGIKSNQLENFLSLDGVTLLGTFTGCVIPNFIDNNGVNQSIDVIVNQATALTGLFLNINEKALDDYANSTYKVDMVGHSLINSTDEVLDFLSYNTPLKNILSYNGQDSLAGDELAQPFDTAGDSVEPYVTSYPYGGNNGKFLNQLVVYKPVPTDTVFTPSMYDALLRGLNTNSLIATYGTNTLFNSAAPSDYVKVDNIIDSGDFFIAPLSNPLNSDASYIANYIEEGEVLTIPTIANQINVNFPSFTPAAGDIILIEAAGYAKYFEIDAVTGITGGFQLTVATTLTTGAPFYRDKFCTAGFAADEFSSFLQPSDLAITLLDVSVDEADFLVPDLATTDEITYILNPTYTYSKIDGVSLLNPAGTVADDNGNLVTLYNVTTSTAISGSWYLKGWEINTTDADFGKIRVVDTTTGNPFNGGTLGDVIEVTLLNGKVITGEVLATSATVVSGAFNLDNTNIAEYAIIEAYPGAILANNINNQLVIDGDRIKYGSGSSSFNYVAATPNYSRIVDAYSGIAYGLKGASVKQFTDSSLLTPANSTFADVNETYVDANIYDDGGSLNYVAFYSSIAKNISENVKIEAPGLYDGGKKFKLSSTNGAKIEVGDYLVDNTETFLTRIVSKVKKTDPVTGVPYFEYSTLVTPKTTVTSGLTYVTCYQSIQKFADRFQFTALSGFTLTDYHLPNNTDAQLDKIYGVLENTNLAKTLASDDVITFRYIVDTFNLGLQPNMGSKQILSRLAKNRQQCLAIINAPSIAEFQASTDPRFTELPDPQAGNPAPVLNTFYISTGGNLSLGPSFVWGLPDEEQGAKFIGVFTPNLIIRENAKNKSIPPAADVSNNFVRKFINGTPYAIVAGPRRGVISNPRFVGMEYDYLLSDRENLEPFGLNPITNVKNVGPMIFANQTAYQRTLSAFNNLHVRDLLITIETAVIEILQQYLFEFNDATTRLEIKTIVENYLDVVRNGGGIFAYSVIMDETNNTAEIIDQNFGVIDIAIEPSRGLQKFINRITVLKTGGISSGGFSAA